MTSVTSMTTSRRIPPLRVVQGNSGSAAICSCNSGWGDVSFFGHSGHSGHTSARKSHERRLIRASWAPKPGCDQEAQKERCAA